MNYTQPVVGTSMLLFNRGKLLLGKRISEHENGIYGPPGGKLDYGETIEDCIRRETYEETHLRVRGLQPLGFISNNLYIKERKHFVVFWFRGEVDAPSNWDGKVDYIETDAQGNKKCEGWDWYSLDQLKTMKLMRTVLEAVEFSGKLKLINTSG